MIISIFLVFAALSPNMQAPPRYARVYVYRYRQYMGNALKPSVYDNESELARMENGRFFVAELTEGKHLVRSNDKQAGIALDVTPGQTYFVRVELVAGMMKGHGRVVLVPSEQGKFEVVKLKYLDRDDIKHEAVLKVAPREEPEK